LSLLEISFEMRHHSTNLVNLQGVLEGLQVPTCTDHSRNHYEVRYSRSYRVSLYDSFYTYR